MKLIGFCLFCLIMIIYLYRKGRKDAYKEYPQGTVIRDGIVYYPSRLHEADKSGKTAINEYLADIDEHSPENLNIDLVLKNINLRNKLINIEKEREL